MEIKAAATWALGGACTGVCVMVALPILAPLGAVTAAGAGMGAIGGGLAGGLFGAVKPSLTNKTKRAEQRENEARERAAEYAITIKELSYRLKERGEKLESWIEFEKFVVVFVAIGFSIAEQNGVLRDDLRQTIEEFVAGVGKNVLPQDVKERIAGFAASPPTFETAKKLYSFYDAAFSDRQWHQIIDGLIDVLSDHPSADNDSIAAWNAAWREELKRAEARKLPSLLNRMPLLLAPSSRRA